MSRDTSEILRLILIKLKSLIENLNLSGNSGGATESTLLEIETILQNLSFGTANEIISLDTTGKLVPFNFDDIEITQFITTGNAIGQPEIIEYRELGSVVATLSITYNIDGCISRVERI